MDQPGGDPDVKDVTVDEGSQGRTVRVDPPARPLSAVTLGPVTQKRSLLCQLSSHG